MTYARGPIARGTVRTTFVLGLRLVVQATTLLLVARMLGPCQFGAFAGVAAFAVLLGTLSTFGMHLVLLGEVAKEPARRHEVLRYALPTTLLSGSILLATYLAVCLLLLRQSGTDIPILLALGAAETLLQPLIQLCASEQHGLGRIVHAQLLRVLPLFFRLAAAAIVFGLAPGDPLGTYAYGYGLASLSALALTLPTLPASWPPPTQWRLPRRLELRKAAGFAALNITQAGPSELDKTLASKLLPLDAAGIYAAGARVIGAINLPVTAMTLSALPHIFRMGEHQPHRVRLLLRWMLGAAFGYSVLVVATLWLIAPLFDWLLGANYNNIARMIRWLCFAIPGMTLRLVAGNVLMALGRPWIRVGFETTGLATLLIASTILTARFDAVGMALALACSEWAMAFIGGTLLYARCRQGSDHQSTATRPL